MKCRFFDLIGLFLLSTLIASCGESESTSDPKEDCKEACLGIGALTPASDQKLTITFPGAATGQQYVILPYSVGNEESVIAASAETPVTFSMEEEAAGSLHLFRRVPKISNKFGNLSETKLIHILRQTSKYLVNRSPKNRPKEMHALVKVQNQVRSELNRRRIELGLANPSNRLNLIKKMSTEPMNLTSAECPEEGDDIGLPDGNEETIPDGGIIAGDDFCLVFLAEPKAETDKEKLKAGVVKIMETYKKTIYVDEFEAKGSFKFAPIIIFADSSKLEAPYDTLLGGFISANTEDEERPVLMMAADLTKVELKNDDAGRSATYATLAHEMQHAISFYYKAVGDGGTVDTSKLETIYLDEGLAHFMEDAFGYGGDSFDEFAGSYLGFWPIEGSSLPFLSETYDADNDSSLRGAAQTLVYFLSSKMGGVDAEEGILQKGAGLNYVASVTKSSKRGAAALKEAFNYSDWTWTKTIGNYLGALVVSGTEIEVKDSDFSVQKPTEVEDLQGTKNKLFGMLFNKYGGVSDRVATEAYGELSSSTVHYYEARPSLYTVKGPDDKVILKLNEDIENTAAMVVRIK